MFLNFVPIQKESNTIPELFVLCSLYFLKKIFFWLIYIYIYIYICIYIYTYIYIYILYVLYIYILIYIFIYIFIYILYILYIFIYIYTYIYIYSPLFAHFLFSPSFSYSYRHMTDPAIYYV